MKGDNLISAFRKISDRFRAQQSALHDISDPEDALQEAFCRLWTRRGDIGGEKAAEGLLATAARNVIIDSVRRNKTHPENSIDEILDVKETFSSDEPNEDIYMEVDRLAAENLTNRDRDILYHREKDGWDFDELSEYYGLSESNVRMIVSRARKKLRDLYNLNHQH